MPRPPCTVLTAYNERRVHTELSPPSSLRTPRQAILVTGHLLANGPLAAVHIPTRLQYRTAALLCASAARALVQHRLRVSDSAQKHACSPRCLVDPSLVPRVSHSSRLLFARGRQIWQLLRFHRSCFPTRARRTVHLCLSSDRSGRWACQAECQQTCQSPSVSPHSPPSSNYRTREATMGTLARLPQRARRSVSTLQLSFSGRRQVHILYQTSQTPVGPPPRMPRQYVSQYGTVNLV